MKFVDIDGKEYNFESPGEAVSWAWKELRKVEKDITGLFDRIKKLKEYKERIYKEFGLKKFGSGVKREGKKTEGAVTETEQISNQNFESQDVKTEQK
jgi:hypothetical protein